MGSLFYRNRALRSEVVCRLLESVLRKDITIICIRLFGVGPQSWLRQPLHECRMEQMQ